MTGTPAAVNQGAQDHWERARRRPDVRWPITRIVAMVVGAHAAAALGADPASVTATRIDDFCSRVWSEHSIRPAAQATDDEYARRVSLDVTGVVPHAADARAFLADQSTGKRLRWAHTMLDGAGHVRHQANVWHDNLLPPGMTPYVARWHEDLDAWLVDRLSRDTPYDVLVRELLTTSVTISPEIPNGRPDRPYERTPIAFYRANEFKPENLAAQTAAVFLGIDLDCAQCHDHPWKPWKRHDFAAFAAFFAGIEPTVTQSGRVVAATERRDRRSFAMADAPPTEARFLDDRQPNWHASSSGREVLADWVTDAGNPFFARAAANRLWAQFFGVPIVTDEDQTFADLLDELAEVLVAEGYDMKVLIRAIVASRPYQLTSQATAEDHPDQERYFARMRVKRLSAEQLRASVDRTAGLPGDTASEARAHFVSQFQTTETNAADRQMSILQSLELLNGPFIDAATSETHGRTVAAVAEVPWLSDMERMEHLYLAAYTRLPTQDETGNWRVRIHSWSSVRDREAALGDVLWVLFNSSEFVFNH